MGPMGLTWIICSISCNISWGAAAPQTTSFHDYICLYITHTQIHMTKNNNNKIVKPNNTKKNKQQLINRLKNKYTNKTKTNKHKTEQKQKNTHTQTKTTKTQTHKQTHNKQPQTNQKQNK